MGGNESKYHQSFTDGCHAVPCRFLYIMPTLLRMYSNNQPNSVLCQAIHFACRQFYILHRKPFVLQMFGSVAPLLDMSCGAGGTLDTSKVCVCVWMGEEMALAWGEEGESFGWGGGRNHSVTSLFNSILSAI